MAILQRRVRRSTVGRARWRSIVLAGVAALSTSLLALARRHRPGCSVEALPNTSSRRLRARWQRPSTRSAASAERPGPGTGRPGTERARSEDTRETERDMSFPRTTRIVVALWAAAGLAACALSLASMLSAAPPTATADRVRRRVRGADGGQLDLAHHALHRRAVGRGRPRRGVPRLARHPRPAGDGRARVRRGVRVRTGHQTTRPGEVGLQRRPGRHRCRPRGPGLHLVARRTGADRLRKGRCRARRRGLLLRREHRRHGDDHGHPGHAVVPDGLRRNQRKVAHHLGWCGARRPGRVVVGQRAHVPAGGAPASRRPALSRHGPFLRPSRSDTAARPLRSHARCQPFHGDRGDHGGRPRLGGVAAPFAERDADNRATGGRRPGGAAAAGRPHAVAGGVGSQPHRALRRCRPGTDRGAGLRRRHRPGQRQPLRRGGRGRGRSCP